MLVYLLFKQTHGKPKRPNAGQPEPTQPNRVTRRCRLRMSIGSRFSATSAPKKNHHGANCVSENSGLIEASNDDKCILYNIIYDIIYSGWWF